MATWGDVTGAGYRPGRRRLRRVRDRGHPGVAGEGVADRSEDVLAVLGGGGYVAADGVPVPGCFPGPEPAGDFLLSLGGADVPLSLVGGRRDAQVGGEAEDVVLAVAQAFQ